MEKSFDILVATFQIRVYKVQLWQNICSITPIMRYYIKGRKVDLYNNSVRSSTVGEDLVQDQAERGCVSFSPDARVLSEVTSKALEIPTASVHGVRQI